MKASRTLAAALALLAAQASLPSCLAGYEQGTAVTLSVRGALEDAVDAAGRAVRIDRAYVHVAGAELVPCEERAERGRRSLVSVARADHGAPGALEQGAFVALHEASTTIGALAPVPGRYCALRVTLQPADAGTEGLGDPSHEGLTVLLEGAWDGGPVRAASPGNAVFDVVLDTPLAITREHPDAAIELTLDVAGALARTDATSDPVDLGLDLIVQLDEHASCARSP